jgi:hypothetical protein
LPISLKKLNNYDRSDDIKEKICQILKENKGNGFEFNELEYFLKNEKTFSLKLGGKFFLYSLMKDLVHNNKIKSIISQGKEYFFIE